MIKTLRFLFTLSMLVCNGNYLNWQGTGNMSQDNLTHVRSYINANISSSWAKSALVSSYNTSLINFATGLSDNLNSLWDPAWNVVVVYIINYVNSDTVLYGYAFRDHWMWLNGFAMDDGNFITFIIWKDYNCIQWITHNRNVKPGYYPSTYSNLNLNYLQNAIKTLYSTLDKSEIWLAAQAYANTLSSNSAVTGSLGSDTAFTIIMSQGFNLLYYGKFCAKDYMGNYEKVGTNGGDWGHSLILQMR